MYDRNGIPNSILKSENFENTICVDLDGVLVDCKNCKVGCDYSKYPENYRELKRTLCPPMEGAWLAMKKLKDMGFEVIIYTARHEVERPITTKWLHDHNIEYNKLVMGKPIGFIYIDDLAHHFNGWDLAMNEVNRRSGKK